MLCFVTRFEAVWSPQSIGKNEKVIDCWSKSSFEVQNCVTVENSTDFIEKTLRLSTKVCLRNLSAQKSKQNHWKGVQFHISYTFWSRFCHHKNFHKNFHQSIHTSFRQGFHPRFRPKFSPTFPPQVFTQVPPNFAQVVSAQVITQVSAQVLTKVCTPFYDQQK